MTDYHYLYQLILLLYFNKNGGKLIKGKQTPELHVLKNLLYTTVRIVTFDKSGEEDGVGTGFFYSVQYLDENKQTAGTEILVTNKHVVRDAQKGSIVFHLGPLKDGFPTGTHETEIDDFESKFIPHPDKDIDLCAIEINPYIREVEQLTGKDVFFQAFSWIHVTPHWDLITFFPIMDVYMVGYPIGLWDETNNLPITRKGVTASHPGFDFNGKSRGVADIATFGGSSGSPIIMYHLGVPRYDEPQEIIFHLLGVLSAGAYMDEEGELIEKEIPTKKTKVPVTQLMVHLGYYVKAFEIRVLEELFIP